LTVPPPPTSPERRLPLRQLPSERPFSASPRNVDPAKLAGSSRFLNTFIPIPSLNPFSDTLLVSDEICHFDSDGFCLFEPFFGELTQLNQLVSDARKNIFRHFCYTDAQCG
jgi:hypothetical protein